MKIVTIYFEHGPNLVVWLNNSEIENIVERFIDIENHKIVLRDEQNNFMASFNLKDVLRIQVDPEEE